VLQGGVAQSDLDEPAAQRLQGDQRLDDDDVEDDGAGWCGGRGLLL